MAGLVVLCAAGLFAGVGVAVGSVIGTFLEVTPNVYLVVASLGGISSFFMYRSAKRMAEKDPSAAIGVYAAVIIPSGVTIGTELGLYLMQ